MRAGSRGRGLRWDESGSARLREELRENEEEKGCWGDGEERRVVGAR